MLKWLNIFFAEDDTTIDWYAKTGRWEQLSKVFQSSSQDINKIYGFRRLLYSAITSHYPDCTVVLLQNGADMYRPGGIEVKRTPLELAILFGDEILVPLLLLHEPEKLPEDSYFDKIRKQIKIKDVSLRERVCKLLSSSLNKAKDYRSALENARCNNEQKKFKAEIGNWQTIIDLLVAEIEQVNILSYRRAFNKKLIVQYYYQKIAFCQNHIMECYKALTTKIELVWDKLTLILEQLEPFPVRYYLADSSNDTVALLTQKCVTLLDSWVTKAIDSNRIDSAIKCLSMSAGWYEALANRITENNLRITYLNQAVNYYRQCEQLDISNKVVYSEKIQDICLRLKDEYTQKGNFEEASAYNRLLQGPW